eukprot:jgi/Mesen1/6737/ME000344S06019
MEAMEKLRQKQEAGAPVEAFSTMQKYGYVPPKMVRTRMLHQWLWGYANSLHRRPPAAAPAADAAAAEGTPGGTAEAGGSSGALFFSMANAVLAIPLQLWLHVVGTSAPIPGMEARCSQGCLMGDLSEAELAILADTKAQQRVSWLLDIMRRLKVSSPPNVP